MTNQRTRRDVLKGRLALAGLGIIGVSTKNSISRHPVLSKNSIDGSRALSSATITGFGISSKVPGM